MALSDYGKICWVVWYSFSSTLLSQYIPPYPQNTSPFESLVQYIPQSIKPCKMSRHQCVCGSVCNHFLLVHLACACAFFLMLVCAVNAHSGPVVAISYLVTLYESSVCQRQERGVRFVHCMTLMPLYPPASRLPNAHWRKVGICPTCLHRAYQDTHTQAIYTKRNWRHTTTLTHLRAKRRERILLWVRETHREVDLRVRVCGAVMADIWL